MPRKEPTLRAESPLPDVGVYMQAMITRCVLVRI
jgi:hypothetical protein